MTAGHDPNMQTQAKKQEWEQALIDQTMPAGLIGEQARGIFENLITSNQQDKLIAFLANFKPTF